jgi:hypothetical protein
LGIQTAFEAGCVLSLRKIAWQASQIFENLVEREEEITSSVSGLGLFCGS